ncbi:MAG: hypothetical protein VYC16_03040 [Pseudomonadota bacterium]|nr:hypothetical protein [Pseudomonadota bacterium]
MAGAIVILILLCAGLCHKLAKDRRRRRAFWVTMAALIGPLAMVLLMFLPDQSSVSAVDGDG